MSRIQVATFAALIALSGCASTGPLGTGGSALSALSATSGSSEENSSPAEIIDAMAGGLVGGSIGSELDKHERRLALEAEYRALEYTPSGKAVKWQGDDDGRYGEVIAAQPYRVGSQDCRQYSHTVVAAAQPRTARGTACRNPDGSWTPLT